MTFEKDKQRRTLPHFLTVDSKGFVRLVRAAIRPIAKKMNRKLDSGEWQDGWRIALSNIGGLIGTFFYTIAAE